jgi:pimeloyl-ACP methyl ester carboxylesterase
MNQPIRYERPVTELWEMWKPRVRMRTYPFTYASYEDVERAMATITSYDRDAWAAAFSAVAQPYETRAVQAEKAGDSSGAKENYLRAYQYYMLARYPTISSDGKKAAYRKSQEMLLKASRYFEVPIVKVDIPFKGRAGEGNSIPAYLREPKTDAGPFALLVTWGGIDGYKEEQLNDAALAMGLAHLAIDGPGVGDSPVKGSEDAERLFEAVFDWAAIQSRLDSHRIGIWGYSTGGYWAVKVAHVYKDRVACAVSQGGPVHYAFEPEWMERQERGEYPFQFFETIAFAFGLSTYEEWVKYAPRLSLLRQGILDGPCAPMLLVNGIHDSVFPIKDYYLLLEHGSPKTARFYDAGHMGFTRDTFETIMNWITDRLK